MKTIYVKSDILNEAVKYLNDEITFFGFLSHVKEFLKQLLVNPVESNVDDYLLKYNLNKEELLKLLLGRGIIEKETKIISKEDGLTSNSVDKFSISYKIPKRNFERKLRRLYSYLFEKNEINETDCSGAMQGGSGSTNPDAGTYINPIGVQRRKIYITDEQSKILKETGLGDIGNYQYDVPLKINNGNDASYNHKNIIDSGIPKKKKGVRSKVK